MRPVIAPAPVQLSLWATRGQAVPAGNLVRRLREAKELSQQVVAGLMGISRASVSRGESGQRSFSYDEIVLLARGTGVDLGDLVGVSPDRLRQHRPAHARIQRSTKLARSLPTDRYDEFLSSGGDLRALRLAAEGRQPLSPNQAWLLLGLLGPELAGLHSRSRTCPAVTHATRGIVSEAHQPVDIFVAALTKP